MSTWARRGDVLLEFLDDGENAVVKGGYVLVAPDGTEYPVHDGTVTDGASIPRALWSIVGSPFTGRYRDVAPWHDQEYKRKGSNEAAANRILRDASIGLGCPRVLAWALFLGVSVGGWWSWRKDQAARKG